jgi:hypothetical protein
MRSPSKEIKAGDPANGVNIKAESIDANPTIGPERNIHDVVLLYTAPFLSSLIISK